MLEIEVESGEKLELRREMSLKVYALLSVNKNIPAEWLVENMEVLSIAFAFSDGDAVLVTRKIIQDKGLNPDDYNHPFMMVKKELNEVVNLVANETRVPFSAITPSDSGPTVMKSVETLETSVRYVFGEVGTPAEKKVMEGVLKRFAVWGLERSQEELGNGTVL